MVPRARPGQSQPKPGPFHAEVGLGVNVLAGLLKTVAAPPHNGQGDLPVVAHTLQRELDDLFSAVEGLQLLGLAEVARGDITLTPAGRDYADAGTQQRKAIFRAHALRNIPLVTHILGVLQARPQGRASRLHFEAELEDHLTEQYARATLNTAIEWGRYAEGYEYDDDSQSLMLEQAQTASAAPSSGQE